MNKQEIAILTKHIFEKISEKINVTYPNKFMGVLYLFIQIENDGEIDYDNYETNGYPEDFKGWHRFRGNLAKALDNGLNINSFEVINKTNNSCIWNVSFSNNSDYQICINNVSSYLENETIAKWVDLELFEISDLFQFCNDLIETLNNEDNIENNIQYNSNVINDHRHQAFYSIYESMFNVYSKLSDQEKSFIEVSLGASLFYLPQKANESWSGDISKRLLYNVISQQDIIQRFVKDHIYSRKRAAKDLLNTKYSYDEFCKKYDSVYRKFSYVTYSENIKLVNWHEDSNSYDEALHKRGISLINIKKLGIEHSKRNKFFEFCKNKTNTEWSFENDLFEEEIKNAVKEFLTT